MRKRDVKAAAKAAVDAAGGEPAQKPAEVMVVSFTVAGEEFAAPIADVREVVEVRDIVPVPNAPEAVEGLVGVRGRIVVVMDPARRFGLPRDRGGTRRHLLVAAAGDGGYGLLTDRIPEVLRVTEDRVRPPAEPFLARIGKGLLTGVIALGEAGEEHPRMLLLLSLPTLFSEKELLTMGRIVREDDHAITTTV